MYSTEIIRKFPERPEKPILYVVYNDRHIREAELFIGMIHGLEYLEENVTIVPFEGEHNIANTSGYTVYIDPTVFMYKNSWNN